MYLSKPERVCKQFVLWVALVGSSKAFRIPLDVVLGTALALEREIYFCSFPTSPAQLNTKISNDRADRSVTRCCLRNSELFLSFRGHC